MPKYIGNAGQYQSERALVRRLNALMRLMCVMMVFLFFCGWVAGRARDSRPAESLLYALVAIAVALPAIRYLSRRLDKQIRLARFDEAGAAGERLLIPALRMLPDTFTVISDFDFADSFGNIDHLIIGPTGLFAIDIKNWNGIVSADGNGELLLNGRPTDKPQARAFTARAMNLRERLKALTRLEPYINCLMVFPHTRVEARWGTTGRVTCLRLDQVADYVMKFKPKTPVSAADQVLLIKAVSALKDTVSTAVPESSPTHQPV